MIMQKPDECKGCDLYDVSQGFSIPEGVGSNGVLVVGESLGWNELQDSLPFRPQAPAGSVLHRIIQSRSKSKRSDFAFWNLIGCCPPGNELDKTVYEFESINHCKVHFDKVINKYKPRVILALGSLPLKHLCGFTGNKQTISHLRGYILRSSRYPNTLVVPSYHPSFLRRGNANLQGLLIWDLDKAVKLAKGELVEGRDYILNPLDHKGMYLPNHPNNGTGLLKYETDPDIEDAQEFLQLIKNNPNLTIAYDIETEKSVGVNEDELEEFGQTISQIQFSISSNSGIAFPYTEPFIQIAKDILATNNPKVTWNGWKFDNPILKSNRFEINGRNDDGMWAFHNFQADLPAGLQQAASLFGFKFPWKHYSGEDLAFYGIADVDATLTIFNKLKEDLIKRDLWKGYDRYVHDLEPILVKTSERGIPINVKKQQEFRDEIEIQKNEIQEKLNKTVSEKVLKVVIKPENGYIREPKEVEEARNKYKSINMQKIINDLEAGTFESFQNYPVPLDYIKEKTGLSLREFKIGTVLGESILKLSNNRESNKDCFAERWCKIEVQQFNAMSPQQVGKLIKSNKHETLANQFTTKIKRETSTEETNGKVKTGKEVLKRLYQKTGVEDYDLIVKFRELTKMEGTFISGDWKPKIIDELSENNEPIGRVHTTFSYRPATWQLSSYNPNVQQQPKHSRLAKKFRETIEASKGRVLLELDAKSFHAKMLGFLAQDKDYIRISSLDVHSFITAHVVNYLNCDEAFRMNDNELESYLKEVKSKHKSLRDDQVKHITHGVGFGLSEKGCYERYRDDFNPSRDSVLDLLANNKRRRKPITDELIAKTTEEMGKENVRKIYKVFHTLFPKVFKFQQFIVDKADRQMYLDTSFGGRRWFWSVKEPVYSSKGSILSFKNGEQAEQCKAYLPASNAFGHIREAHLILEEMGVNEEAKLISNMHDAMLFEPLEKDALYWAKIIKEVMERKSTILINESMPEGFSCAADVMIGKNLAEMKEVKL